jgi:hypothetical protein
VWALAALWLGLALVASLLSIWLRISTALSEIVVGTIAQLIIGAAVGSAILGTDESWVKFLSGLGAIVLTFLAGTRSAGIQAQMEGGRIDRTRQLLLSVFLAARRRPTICSDGS